MQVLTPSNEPLRILLADDHALVRGGLSLVIKSALVGSEIIEASDYRETMERLSADPNLDLLLLDLKMPGVKGLEGLKYICESHPEIPVAVISVEEDARTIRAALAMGAVGYIPKTSSPNVTTGAIQLIVSGGIYVPPHVLGEPPRGEAGDDMFLTPAGGPRPTEPDAKALGVTRRQKDVLDLLSTGKSNKQIAAELGLTAGTVKMHTSRIFKQLGVSNRTQAVAKYTQMKRDLEGIS